MLNFLIETFFLGLKNLRLHKLRSLLTALGIIIGVAAVIIMVAIGQGSKEAALLQMQQLGAKNILIRSVKPPETSEATQRTQSVLEYGLTRIDISRLRNLPRGMIVRSVAMRDTEQKVTRAGIRATAEAIGTEPGIFSIINLPLYRGRYFNVIDYDNAAEVCVIGSAVAQQLFPYQDPLNAEIQVGTSSMGTAILTVVGVLEPTGLRGEGQTMIGRDLDQGVYFPLTLAQRTFGDSIIRRQAGSFERKTIQISEVWLQSDEIVHVEPLAAIAENVIKGAHGATVDYTVKAPIQILRAAERQNRVFNFIMVGIASFALVVGGIGIMNIMLVSVIERTKEIGLRKSVGATNNDILQQFLVESVMLTFIGGVIGIVVGGMVVSAAWFVITKFAGIAWTFEFPMSAILLAVAVSSVTGIAFGIYPARQAARKSPIEALRYE